MDASETIAPTELHRVLEFYSGIGGMNYALQHSGVSGKVVAAFDINTTANDIYRHNHDLPAPPADPAPPPAPATANDQPTSTTAPTKDIKKKRVKKTAISHLHQRNIEAVPMEQFDSMKASIWLMSPPCQPYTRTGNQEGSKDQRAKSFLYLLSLLSKMKHPPHYMLVENVKGFEESDTRDLLCTALEESGFEYQEFLLTPLQMGVPNSRMRYYLLARKMGLVGGFRFGVAGTPIHFIPESVQEVENAKLEIGGGVSHTVSSSTSESNSIPTLTTGPSSRKRSRDLAADPEDRVKEHEPTTKKPHSSLPSVPTPTLHQSTNSPRLFAPGFQDTRHQGDITIKPQGSVSFASANATGDEQVVAAGGVVVDKIRQYLDFTDRADPRMKQYAVPDKILLKYGRVFDIVTADQQRSCCFTKAYYQFVSSTGSILQMEGHLDTTSLYIEAGEWLQRHDEAVASSADVAETDSEMLSEYQQKALDILQSLGLRYFTEYEVAKLMGFPTANGKFSFPNGTTLKQRYRVLGNSINVNVVGELIKYLTAPGQTKVLKDLA